MRRLLIHAAVFLPVAFAGPSALAQREQFEPTRAEMMAIISAEVISRAKTCGIDAALLDATTEHAFRVVRAKARDDAEFHSAMQYFHWMYATYELRNRNIAGNPRDCGTARALFDRWDGMLDEAVER